MADRDFLVTQPFTARASGGTSMRNVKRHGCVLSGMREVVWHRGMIPHTTHLAEAVNLTGRAPGDPVIDRAGTHNSWTSVHALGYAVTLDKNDAAGSEGATFRLKGYDHFDRYVEEDIVLTDGEDATTSGYAYNEVIELVLLAEGSTEISDLNVSLVAQSDNNNTSINLSATGINVSTRVGLPFIPSHPAAVKAVFYAQDGVNGHIVRTGDDTWNLRCESGSVGTSAALTDNDVYGGDIGNATFLIPVATNVESGSPIVFVFDREYIRNFS